MLRGVSVGEHGSMGAVVAAVAHRAFGVLCVPTDQLAALPSSLSNVAPDTSDVLRART